MARGCEIASRTFVNDDMTNKIVRKWLKSFPDARVLPEFGVPSTSDGVMIITHTLCEGQCVKINGLMSRSILTNNSFYSVEVSNGRFLNLYSAKIPDIPGRKENLLQFKSMLIVFRNLVWISQVSRLVGWDQRY